MFFHKSRNSRTWGNKNPNHKRTTIKDKSRPKENATKWTNLDPKVTVVTEIIFRIFSIREIFHKKSLKSKHNFIKNGNVQPLRFLFFQKSWLYLIAIPDDSVNNDGTVDDEESTKNADQRLSSKNT